MYSFVNVYGVFTSHNFVDGRTPLPFLRFLRHLANETFNNSKSKICEKKGKDSGNSARMEWILLGHLKVVHVPWRVNFERRDRRQAPWYYGIACPSLLKNKRDKLQFDIRGVR